jgi:hypothetical protein
MREPLLLHEGQVNVNDRRGWHSATPQQQQQHQQNTMQMQMHGRQVQHNRSARTKANSRSCSFPRQQLMPARQILLLLLHRLLHLSTSRWSGEMGPPQMSGVVVNLMVVALAQPLPSTWSQLILHGLRASEGRAHQPCLRQESELHSQPLLRALPCGRGVQLSWLNGAEGGWPVGRTWSARLQLAWQLQGRLGKALVALKGPEVLPAVAGLQGP